MEGFALPQRARARPMSDQQTTQPTDENQLIAERREKLKALREAHRNGKGPAFPNDFKPEQHASQLQATHAFLVSDPEAAKKVESQIDGLEKTITDAGTIASVKVLRLEVTQIMGSVIPSTDDVVAMARMADRYREEREAAEVWAESYEDKVLAYERAGEHYEWGMLCAEIGIVIASIALMLSSRAAWLLSIGLGIACVIITGT